MQIDDEKLPQSIRLMLLKTAYPKITLFNPGCSSELMAILTTDLVPQNISQLFLHVFGSKEKPNLKQEDIDWANDKLKDKPALAEVLNEFLVKV